MPLRIRSLSDLAAISAGSHVLCLYSGGLDGTYLLSSLGELRGVRVTALTVSLGSGESLGRIRRATDFFGMESIIVDRTVEFAERYVASAIHSQAVYLGAHPISASLSRPLIAQTACEVAAALGYGVILHTSNRSQNSLRRFNSSLASLGFAGLFGSPFELSGLSREAKIEALRRLGLEQGEDRSYSTDVNLWCREIEYGPLDDPESIDLASAPFVWTSSGAHADSISVVLRFTGGRPTHLDGRPIHLVPLIRFLNEAVGSRGLGRYVGLEEIQDGFKVQELREMPAAHILLDAYRRLESACVPAEVIRVKMNMEQLWVREAVEGRWFGPLRVAAQAFNSSVANAVSGDVTYVLGPGEMSLRALRADKPLYVRDRIAFEEQMPR
ncbi:MAG TPA: argininosuccinate synthase-related protein [Longimicrobiaceae bacterium]|nr:argininosuccinate synthase-related protein [Longimicrobiaceae bacterium]